MKKRFINTTLHVLQNITPSNVTTVAERKRVTTRPKKKVMKNAEADKPKKAKGKVFLPALKATSEGKEKKEKTVKPLLQKTKKKRRTPYSMPIFTIPTSQIGEKKRVKTFSNREKREPKKAKRFRPASQAAEIISTPVAKNHRPKTIRRRPHYCCNN